MIETPLPRSPAQLIDAYLNEASLVRRDVANEDADRVFPSLSVRVKEVSSIPGDPAVPGDPTVLAVIVEAEMEGKYNDDLAVAHLIASVAGIFRIQNPETMDVRSFVLREAVLLSYPYLRSMVGQIWRASGLPFPPLPTLDTLATVDVFTDAMAQLDAMKQLPEPEEKVRRIRKRPACPRAKRASGVSGPR